MITVVIPTHNRSDLLSRALESIREQSVLPSEVIVVDDGSDIPVDVSIFSSFPLQVRCSLYRNNVSVGVAASRNIGIRKASFPYIAFLDDDDEFSVKKIEKLEKVITADTPDLVFHSIRYQYINENVSRTVYRQRGELKDAFQKLLRSNIIGSASSVIIKKNALDDIGGGFCEYLTTQEDYELWLRFAYRGKKIMALEEPLTIYNCQTKTQSLSKNQQSNFEDKTIVFQFYRTEFTSEAQKEQQFSNFKESWHRSLVNYNKLQMCHYAWQCFITKPSIGTLILWIISHMSPRKIIYLLCLLKR